MHSHHWFGFCKSLCAVFRGAADPGRPDRAVHRMAAELLGTADRSAAGWSLCERFLPRTPDAPKDWARSRCWCWDPRSVKYTMLILSILKEVKFWLKKFSVWKCCNIDNGQRAFRQQCFANATVKWECVLTLYCRRQYRSLFRAAERSSPQTTSLAIIGS